MVMVSSTRAAKERITVFAWEEARSTITSTKIVFLSFRGRNVKTRKILQVLIGARRGGSLGQLHPPPWNLKMMTSYAVSVEDTLKFTLVP